MLDSNGHEGHIVNMLKWLTRCFLISIFLLFLPPKYIHSQDNSTNEFYVMNRTDELGMNTRIIYSKGFKEYADLVSAIIQPMGFDIRDDNGVLGIVKKPVNTIFVLDEDNFNLFLKKIDGLRVDIAPKINEYKNIQGFKKEAIKLLLLKKQEVTLKLPLAFWFPLFRDEFTFKGIKLIPGECYICICPTLVMRLSELIKNRVGKDNIKDVEKVLFRVTLMHELGHHYLLSNLTANDWVQTDDSKYINDVNFAEGLANLFAYRASSLQERIILAEMAANQDIPYKLYLDLRYYVDMRQVFNILINETDYLKAFTIFAKLMGGDLELGNSTMVVEKADAINDYSDGGGNILAGEIGMLFPYKGLVVASKINRLEGRFPREALIISNDINEFPDYSSLPENIKLISKEKHDIAKIIDNYKKSGLGGENLLKAVIREINIDISNMSIISQ